MFEHSTGRMFQMMYGAVADPENDESVRQIMDWLDVVYLSSTYALVSAWIDDKHDKGSVWMESNLTTGEVRQKMSFIEMTVPNKYKRATKRL